MSSLVEVAAPGASGNQLRDSRSVNVKIQSKTCQSKPRCLWSCRMLCSTDAVLCFNCSARPSTRRLAVHGPCARKESFSCDQRWLATSSQLLASMLGSEHDELRDDTPLDSAYFRVGAANHEYSCDDLSAACRVRTSQTLCTLMSRARLEEAGIVIYLAQINSVDKVRSTKVFLGAFKSCGADMAEH
jgi:hypothetical protein